MSLKTLLLLIEAIPILYRALSFFNIFKKNILFEIIRNITCEQLISKGMRNT